MSNQNSDKGVSNMSSKKKTTDLKEFFESCNGGVFSEKIIRALTDVAMGCLEHGAKGKVAIVLDFKAVPDTTQVAISHTIDYKRPTRRGQAGETDTTSTPFFVNPGGDISLFPRKDAGLLQIPGQHGVLFDKETGETGDD